MVSDMDLGSWGFRRDPMGWAKSAEGLDAAWVRALVLEQPGPGDAEIIGAEIARVLAQQRPDEHIVEETHGALMRLLVLGCPPERPEFRLGLEGMHDHGVARDGHLKGYELHITCHVGWRALEN